MRLRSAFGSCTQSAPVRSLPSSQSSNIGITSKERSFMDIPVNVEVHSADGLCGRSTTVILNPTTEKVTHVVVAERGLFGIEHLVPLDQVVETTPTAIRLRCRTADLAKLDPFVEAHFIGG